MGIIASEGSGSSIPPHPAGQFPAVCIDVIDAGMVERTFNNHTKMVHRAAIRFFCDQWFDGSDGKLSPQWVDAWFTLSLHPKSRLRPFLEAWRGRKFTAEELKGFDLEKLLGAPAFLQIDHNETSERTYANIVSVMRLPQQLKAPGAPAYIRVQDREDAEPGSDEDEPPIDAYNSVGSQEEDIPF